MKPPIPNAVESTPQVGASLRIRLKDGTQAAAIFSTHWWDETNPRRARPVRWQGVREPGRGEAPVEKQTELGLEA